MKYRLLLAIIIFISGCANAYKINNVSLGMTKAQVIEVMGRPNSTLAKGDIEYLSYLLYETDEQASYDWPTNYFIRIIDGKVESYGRMGDFDSTKTPKQELDIKINK